MFEKRHHKLLPKHLFFRRVVKNSFIAFLIIAFSLFVGTLGYHLTAGFSWIDALYNAAMILTSMGPPDTISTDTAKIFATCYALFSGIAFITTITMFLAPFVHRFLHKFHLDDENEAPTKMPYE